MLKKGKKAKIVFQVERKSPYLSSQQQHNYLANKQTQKL